MVDVPQRQVFRRIFEPDGLDASRTASYHTLEGRNMVKLVCGEKGSVHQS